MPERIWLDWPGAKHGEPIYTEPPERDTQAGQTEYVRADIVQALTAERDRLRLYAGHDDDCTINRYPATGACSCGLRAALPAVQPDPVPNSRRSPMEHERDLGGEG